MTGPTHTLHARLPKPLVVALTQLASETGLTRSELLASLLADRLVGYVPKYDVYGVQRDPAHPHKPVDTPHPPALESGGRRQER